MIQMEMDVPKQKKRVIECPVDNCKKLAWEEIAIDNKKYFFCPKHGPVKKSEEKGGA